MRSDVSQRDLTDHAADQPGAFTRASWVEAPPTHGMNHAAMSGFASRPFSVRVIRIASPTLFDGCQGKIKRPFGRSACSHDRGGARTAAFT